MRGIAILMLVGLAGCTRSPETEASFDMDELGFCSWREAAPLDSPRIEASTVVLDDGRILLVGGWDETGERIGSTRVYDPIADSWIPGPQLATPRSTAALARLSDGRVFVVNGVGGDPNAAEILDIGAGSSVPAGNLLFESWSRPTVLNDGRVLIDVPENSLMKLQVYDPTTDEWSAIAAPPTPLGAPSLYVHGDRVAVFAHAYATGDFDICPGQQRDPSAYWLEPSSGTWSPIEVPPCYGTYAQVIPLPSDRVFLTGGGECDLDSSCVSEFDFESGWVAREPAEFASADYVWWGPGDVVRFVSNRSLAWLDTESATFTALPDTPFPGAHLTAFGDHQLLATSVSDDSGKVTDRVWRCD